MSERVDDEAFIAVTRAQGLSLMRTGGALVVGIGSFHIALALALGFLTSLEATEHQPLSFEFFGAFGLLVGVNGLLTVLGCVIYALSPAHAPANRGGLRAAAIVVTLVLSPVSVLGTAASACVGTIVLGIAYVLLLAALPKVLR